MTAPILSKPLGVRTAGASDAARIATFVRSHPDATPFHLPQWTAATARATRQRARYLVAEHADGTIAGVLPLTEIRSPLFGSALVSTGFGTDGGILADNSETVTALASAAWALAEELGIGSVELRGGPKPGDDWAVQEGTYLGFARDLAADDDAELKRIPRNRRAVIRKAMAAGVTIETGSTDCDLAWHYQVYAESVRNLGTPVFPRALFAEVVRAFGDDADVLTVLKDGHPVASVLSLYFNGTVFPYWGGSTTTGKAINAADAMYFALMGHARDRGCTRFDFGRSKAGTGPAAYKGFWGFEAQPLSYAVRTRPGEEPRVVNPLSPKYRLQVAAWKRLPLWAANLVGPQLSRGLG